MAAGAILCSISGGFLAGHVPGPRICLGSASLLVFNKCFFARTGMRAA